jgi:uncharacterized protein YlzI (FlbEa/FlbD family)
MRLIGFTDPNGQTVLINPKSVVRVRETIEHGSDASCIIDLINGELQAVQEGIVTINQWLTGAETIR